MRQHILGKERGAYLLMRGKNRRERGLNGFVGLLFLPGIELSNVPSMQQRKFAGEVSRFHVPRVARPRKQNPKTNTHLPDCCDAFRVAQRINSRERSDERREMGV